MKTKSDQIALGLILIIAFTVRLIHQDPWYSTLDPYSYYTNAIKLFLGYFESVSLWVWFIGYPLLITIFFMIFGVSTTSAVYVSTFFGVLTVLTVYLLGKELVSEEAGLLSALMVALSPTHAYMSSTIMSDVPSLFFVSFTIYLFIKFLRTNKDLFLYASSFFFGWAVLVRPSNGILILIPFIHKLVTDGFAGISPSKSKTKKYMIALSVFILAFSPQLAYNYLHNGNLLEFTVLATESEVETGFSIRNAFTTGYLRTIPPIIHYPYILFFKYSLLPPFLAIFYVLGVIFFIKEKKKDDLTLLILWFILPYLLLLFVGAHDTPTRFALSFLPSLAILGSTGLYYTVKLLFKEKYRMILALVGLSYLVMIIPTYWLITDNGRVHSLENDYQSLVNCVSEDDAFILASKHHIDPHIDWVMHRDAIDLRVALAEDTYHIDPGIDFQLKEAGDGRSPREKLEALFNEHPNLYVLVSYYGNEEVENFGVLEEYAVLELVGEERVRLSMMSPWRAYTISLYKVVGLKNISG